MVQVGRWLGLGLLPSKGLSLTLSLNSNTTGVWGFVWLTNPSSVIFVGEGGETEPMPPWYLRRRQASSHRTWVAELSYSLRAPTLMVTPHAQRIPGLAMVPLLAPGGGFLIRKRCSPPSPPHSHPLHRDGKGAGPGEERHFRGGKSNFSGCSLVEGRESWAWGAGPILGSVTT